jgi:phage recombination protein Bet
MGIKGDNRMTGTEIDTRQAALAIRAGQQFWTREQQAALAVLGIRNVSNADLAVFMHYCQKTGLDPFSRQIYGIMRRELVGGQWVDKFTIQVGIDGFRVIRDRVCARLGISVEYEDTVWYDADGTAHLVWLWEDAPAACKVTVLKDGKPFPGVVRTASYIAMKDGKPVSQWRSQPDHMIEKCAEAFALRRAFPHDLGGLYIPEEMSEQLPASVTVQARAERMTAAELTGIAPAANGDGHAPQADAQPAVEPVQAAEAADPSPASPTMAGRLEQLFQLVPLGTEADAAEFIAWVTGHPAEAELTAGDVKKLTARLDGALKAAKGDGEQAASALWQQYKQAQP